MFISKLKEINLRDCLARLRNAICGMDRKSISMKEKNLGWLF
jgi:hypothetical protein